MKRKILFSLLVISMFYANSTFADPCEGLSGNAFGLCNAATSLGNECDVDPSKISCTRLAARYEQLTGQTPPWLVTITCPTTLNALANWYESDQFENVTEINLLANFTNNGSNPMKFSTSTPPQVWSVPDVLSLLQ